MTLPSHAKAKTQEAESKATAASQNDSQENTKAYIELLRRDVRQEKAEIMGSVMLLSAQDAAKFWPIYSEYDAQLAKLNNQRIENIKEYVRSYNQMTDAESR